MPTTGRLAEWLRYIEVVFSTLTVGECVDILLSLGFEHSVFRADDNEIYPLIGLKEIDEIQGDDACQYPLYFIGGPPTGDEKWFYGTIVTWVVDAILHNLAVTDGALAMEIITDVEDIWADDNEDDSEARWGLCDG